MRWHQCMRCVRLKCSVLRDRGNSARRDEPLQLHCGATMPRMKAMPRPTMMTVLLAPLLAACAMAAAPAFDSDAAPAAVRSLLPALRDDAARRAGVAPAVVRVASVQAVTWPDGSLGCPQADRLYTQALVPGWRISMAVAGRTLTYHASQTGSWTWCQPERATPALPASDDPGRAK